MIFVIIVIAIAGAYQAFTVPVAVFPSTDFPRIVIGIENGVMPIDQMMVTITRPLEEAVNSVAGFAEGPLRHQSWLRGNRSVFHLGR